MLSNFHMREYVKILITSKHGKVQRKLENITFIIFLFISFENNLQY